MKHEKVTLVMIATLRSNHTVNDGKIITLMQRTMYPVSQKYPDKLTLIKTIGESEPACLYGIKY